VVGRNVGSGIDQFKATIMGWISGAIRDSARNGSGLQINGATGLLTPPPWTTPTLQNGWVAFGAGYALPGFCQMTDGTVCLSGVYQSGTVGIIFVLPANLWPVTRQTFTVQAAGGTARVDVNTSGNVLLVSYNTGGTNASLSLCGIRFSTIG
jgi:hypothetical protein